MLHRIAVKGVVLSLIAWSLVLPLTAQDVPKMDIFAGYSFLRSQVGGQAFVISNNDTPQKAQPIDGFNASVTENLNKGVGITEDLSGYYSDAGIKDHTLLVGPQLSFRQAHGITPFIHGLFGVNYQTPVRQSPIINQVFLPPTPPNSNTTGAVSTSVSQFIPGPRGGHAAFAMAFGGGVDYNVNPRLSIRLVQADYFRNTFKFTQGFANQECEFTGTGATACTTPSIFSSIAERHNNLRLSFGVVFHL